MIKRLKRRFGISAPRLSVRPHVPWYVRWAITLPFLFLSGYLIWWSYDAGLELAGFHRGKAQQKITALQEKVGFLEAENANQAGQLAVNERQLQMQQAAAAEVQEQLKTLQNENTLLKEDLSFFQNLPLTEGSDAALSIHSLKVDAGTLPGEFRCRMLLVQGVQRRGKEFDGALQIVVNAEQGGQKVVLQFPQQGATDTEAQRLNFRYYQRVERVFQVPQDVHVESVEIRVFEKGLQAPKVKQTILLS